MARSPLLLRYVSWFVSLSLFACAEPSGGGDPPPPAEATTYAHRAQALEDGPSVRITSPQQFYTVPFSDPTSVEVQFAVTGVTDETVRFYLDDILVGTQEPPETAYTFESVPIGAHTLTVVLVDSAGDELRTAAAAASVEVRVEPTCMRDSDCDDGNPCSTETCFDFTACRYGAVADASCCNTRFDCPPGPGGWRFCENNQCEECVEDEHCDDGNVCTVSRCRAGRCDNESVPGCCTADADCDDGDGCTPDRCVDFVCVHDPGPANCCTAETAPFRCDDDDPCTVDACVGGSCHHSSRAAGCCATDIDCDDGDACTLDRCDVDTNRCEHIPDLAQPECCDDHWQCDDGDPATIDSCETWGCVHTVDPRYCATDLDCEASANPCLWMACLDNICTRVPLWGCCRSDRDCNDYDDCTVDSCSFNTCTYTPIPNCCLGHGDCDDGNPCTNDACIRGVCRHGRVRKLASCCVRNAECDDGDPCTMDRCAGDHNCEYVFRGEVAGCCRTGADCDDGDPETRDICSERGSCRHEPATSSCVRDGDCDDGVLCTDDVCVAGSCTNVWRVGCCAADSDCEDGDACTTDSCDVVTGQCSNATIRGCCLADVDCDDGAVCTRDMCFLNRCVNETISPCCADDAACDDGNACTVDSCDPATRHCVNTPRKGEGCCLSDAACDDGDSCTRDSCIRYHCYNLPIPGCCKVAAHCADDNPCTADLCIYGMCRHLPPSRAPFGFDIPSACCEKDGDCPSDGNPCTRAYCSDGGTCAVDFLATCAATLPYFQTFHLFTDGGWGVYGWQEVGLDGDVGAGWSVAEDGRLGPDRHLTFSTGDTEERTFLTCATTPTFDLSREAPPVTLSWEYALASVSRDTTVSVLAIVDGNVGAPVPVWEHVATSDETLVGTAVTPSALFASRRVQYAFCVGAETPDAFASFELDTVKIVRGHAPEFVSSFQPLRVPADSRAELMLEALDPDSGDVLAISLVDPPPFVSVGETFYRPSDRAFIADLTIQPRDDGDMGEYAVRAIVTDGLLSSYLVIDLTIIHGHCENGVLDAGEVDVDCGGECAPCGDGATCGDPADCASGHCQNGYCCADGDCCAAASDCPASYGTAPVCDTPRRCDGHRMAAVCVASVCDTERTDDDSACGPFVVANRCGYYPSVMCSGEPSQGVPDCPTSCAILGVDDDSLCDEIAHCDGGLCVGDLPDGQSCDENGDCQSGQCVAGICHTPCATVADCPAGAAYCQSGVCLDCLSDEDDVALGRCVGVCALTAPTCVRGFWQCTGPGYEPIEVSCDGFDNDCDGSVDEGVCPDCAPGVERIRERLANAWDIDFDQDCNTYLATVSPGIADGVRYVPAATWEEALDYDGNAVQDLPFGAVVPNPDQPRYLGVFGCDEAGGCAPENGVVELGTCTRYEDDCPCAGDAECPGVASAPFLSARRVDTGLTFAGRPVSAPTGLAVGPDGAWYVGNFAPLSCVEESDACDACDPSHPDVWCSPTGDACCRPDPAAGRLVRFDPPSGSGTPRWRLVASLDGETIYGLAAGRDGSVMVGTGAGDGTGNLYRYSPVDGSLTLFDTLDAPAFSLTQDRGSGEWYVETRGAPKMRRYADDGLALSLPAGLPPEPEGQGVVQAGPDGRLYRLVPSAARLEVYELPGDRDGDGVPDDSDDFPDDPTEWRDTDGDGVGDNGDDFPDDPAEWQDTDGDGVGDNADEFPDDPTEWDDLDGDGIGDNSDPDVDGDLVGNDIDNCVRTPNAGQEDLDGDGAGDACDDDDDADGTPDVDDCRPLDANSFPGAPEVCDGVDNDCDGGVDERCVAEALFTLTGTGLSGAPVGAWTMGLAVGQVVTGAVFDPDAELEWGVCVGTTND